MPLGFLVAMTQHLRARRNLTIEFSDKSVENPAAWVLRSWVRNSDGLLFRDRDSKYANQYTDDDNRDSGIGERSGPPLPL